MKKIEDKLKSKKNTVTMSRMNLSPKGFRIWNRFDRAGRAKAEVLEALLRHADNTGFEMPASDPRKGGK